MAVAISLLVVMALAAPPSAFARPALAWCNGCTEQQREHRARTSIAEGEVYVGDVDSSRVHAYAVTRVFDNSQRPPLFLRKEVAQMAPDEAVVRNVLTLREWHNTPPRGWVKAYGGVGQPRVDYPGGQGSSVYDLVVAGPAQNDLADWVAQQAFLAAHHPGRVIQAMQTLDLVDPDSTPKSIVTVTFENGSTLELEMDPGSSNAGFRAVKDSGRDRNNNTVLSEPRTTPVLFKFDPSNSSDYSDWMSWMKLLGYSMQDAGHGAGHVYVCTSSAAGYHCGVYLRQ